MTQNNFNRSNTPAKGLAKVNKHIAHAFTSLGTKISAKPSPLPSLPSLEFIQYNDECSPDPPAPTWRDREYRTLRDGRQIRIFHTFKVEGLTCEHEYQRRNFPARGRVLLDFSDAAAVERRKRESDH
jgi:hypothetical protein